jgi:L-ascorbate metabolism protein UlaG (beta-lactamase superfamily)
MSVGSTELTRERRRRLSYLGHSTTLIEIDGVRILTDPLLRRRVAHLWRSSPAPGHGSPDAVLISHGHQDHLDLPSLRRLPRSTPIVIPRGLGRVVAARGFEDVREVVEGEEVVLGPVTVRATHADHHGRSMPGRSQAAVGYAVLGSGSVFFAGDTGLFDGMNGLVPDLELALLPIWGWGSTIGPGHLDPRDAAEGLTLLRPRHAVPIHWGTYRPFYLPGDSAFLREPADAFVAAARELAPEVAVHVLEPGESLDF